MKLSEQEELAKVVYRELFPDAAEVFKEIDELKSREVDKVYIDSAGRKSKIHENEVPTKLDK